MEKWKVEAAMMEACWLKRGPAGVSKSDIIPKSAIVETITIPTPNEWKEMFSMLEEEDEEREEEMRNEFWANYKEK